MPRAATILTLYLTHLLIYYDYVLGIWMILFLPTEGLGCRCPTKRSSPPIKHLLYMLDHNDSNLRLNIHLRLAYLSAICSTFFLLEVILGTWFSWQWMQAYASLSSTITLLQYKHKTYNQRDKSIPIAVRTYVIPQSSRKSLQYTT